MRGSRNRLSTDGWGHLIIKGDPTLRDIPVVVLSTSRLEIVELPPALG